MVRLHVKFDVLFVNLVNAVQDEPLKITLMIGMKPCLVVIIY